MRNDAATTNAVMQHIAQHYAQHFGEVHTLAAVRSALEANDATVGCQIADAIAERLAEVRKRFCKKTGW